MMGNKARAFAPLAAVSLEDLAPADQLYRHLERTLDLAFVRDQVGECYSSSGETLVVGRHGQAVGSSIPVEAKNRTAGRAASRPSEPPSRSR